MPTGISDRVAGMINVFPNPFNQSTTIRFPNPSGEAYRMVLTDLSGKVCRIVNDITNSDYVLKRGELKEGMYFIELIGSQTFRCKIIMD